MNRTSTLFFLLLLPFFLSSQNVNYTVISKKLAERMAEAPQAWQSVNIVLAAQPDYEQSERNFDAAGATASERARSVVFALRAMAQQSQPALIDWLRQQPGVQPETIRGYWVANAVFATVKKEVVENLSLRSDVMWIGLNGPLAKTKVEVTPPPPGWTPGGREKGLEVINAPALWAMGYTGYGRVAFTNDTGVDPTHPAIAGKYLGLYRSGPQTWFELDPATLEPAEVYQAHDCGSHGTHVTGTMLGLDRLNDDTIGVAFNALWIGAPVLCGIGTEDNVAAFQWALDPDGDPNTTDDIPDVINNSWYDPNLDTIDCYSLYVPVVQAMEAAGIAVVFSAGNEGPGPMTITPPHNINLNEVNSFTIGALNGNLSSLPIANFSSRGPSHCGGDSSLLIKPEVSAPGVSVRSCVPGNEYDFFSGTSMAAPHTSGAILLLKEAFPELPGKLLKQALYYTAHDLGDPGEDNVYGRGLIDVLAAYNYLVEQGYNPVLPQATRDVLLIELQAPAWACNAQIQPEITLENAGTDTLYSLEVEAEVEGVTSLDNWTGVLAPGGRLSLVLPQMEVPAGERDVVVTLFNPNGQPDDRPLNNRLKKRVHISNRSRFVAHAQGNEAVCEGTRALLRGEPNPAIAAGEGSYKVQWYDAPTGGNLLGEGPVFETPALSQPVTFYAEASYQEHFAPSSPTFGDTAFISADDLGLRFDVNHEITLKSLTVFVSETGGRFLRLVDQDGHNVAQKVIFPSAPGANVVELNWKIPAGKGYQLKKAGGKPLLATLSQAAYPYELDEVLRITNNTAGDPGAYYFFYDWVVEYREPCERTPVSVDVLPFTSLPQVSFDISEKELFLPDNATATFTNTSPDAVATFLWNFGDGHSSVEEHPVHTYSQAGSYVVSFQLNPLDGCPAYALDTVQVLDEPLNAVEGEGKVEALLDLFPNPANVSVGLHFHLDRPAKATLLLFDALGKLASREEVPLFSSNLEVQTAHLAPGMYYLSVVIDGRVITRKLAIIH